jgi:NUMOD4 motif-containing protein/HNH endonuclease
MAEIWKDIVGFEGRYQVSNLGNVKSLDRVTKTKKGQRAYKGKVCSNCLDTKGYVVVNLSSGSEGVRQHYVHRLVATAFLGASTLQVNHKDLRTDNNNIENLEYVTMFENSLHAFKSGVKIGRTRLTATERKEIRELRAKGANVPYLATKYAMSQPAIYEVLKGTTWAWERK